LLIGATDATRTVEEGLQGLLDRVCHAAPGNLLVGQPEAEVEIIISLPLATRHLIASLTQQFDKRGKEHLLIALIAHAFFRHANGQTLRFGCQQRTLSHPERFSIIYLPGGNAFACT
jgi:hypothetical protein